MVLYSSITMSSFLDFMPFRLLSKYKISFTIPRKTKNKIGYSNKNLILIT